MRTDLASTPGAMARGAAVNLLGAVAAFALAFLFRLVVTHVVSVDDFGRLSIALTIVTLAQVPALLGLDTGAIRFVALGAAAGDERAARGSVQVALGVVALASAAIAVVLAWQAPWLASHLFHGGGAAGSEAGRGEVASLLRLVAASLPGLALARVAIGAIQGFGVMRYGAWLGSLRVVLNLATALPLLALGFGVRGLGVAALVTALATCGVALACLARVHPRAFVPAPDAWRLGRMLRFSAPQTLTATLLQAILWTDTLLLARYGSAGDVGVYAIIGGVLQPATFVATAVGQMFAPRIVAEDARGDRPALARMLKRVTYWNTATSVPLYATLILLPAPILALFGSAYERGAAALVILALGQFVNTAAGPLGQVINMSGRPYVSLLDNAFVATVNLAIGLVLVPRYGLVGAACSTAVALALVNGIKLVQVRHIFGMHPFRRDTLRALAAAVGATAVAAPIAFVPPWPAAFPQVAAAGAALVLAYGVLVSALGLDEEDRALFWSGRQRLARYLPLGRRAVRPSR